MTKNAEVLLISSIIIILSYFTAILFYNIGLTELELPRVEETNDPIIYTIEDWDEFVRSKRLNTNIWHSNKRS